MSPRISPSININDEKSSKKKTEVKTKIKEFQSYIKQNFEYVGNNFAYEARSIHYGDKKSKKGIFGNANKEDLKELKDEGIETAYIPWVNDKEN